MTNEEMIAAAQEELARRELARRQKASKAGEQGMLWPRSRDEQGEWQWDSDAGIVGALKRAATLPYDVIRGNVQMIDPETGRTSDEAIQRAGEFAGVTTPINPAVRSGDKIIPGIAKNLRRADTPAPSADALHRTAASQRRAMTDTGATYPSGAVQRLPDFIEQKLRQDKFVFAPETAPRTYALVAKLRDAPPNSYSTIDDLVSLRQTLGKLAQGDGSEKYAATQAIKALDDFIGRFGDMASPNSANPVAIGRTVGSTPEARKRAADLLKESNANFAAGFRSDTVQGIERAADLRASAANSGQNTGNAIRQRVASKLISEKDVAGFNEQELKALEDIVRGSRAANRTRDIGNMLGGGGGLGAAWLGGMGGAAGAYFGGTPGAAIGAAAPIVAGKAIKGVSNRLTQRALNEADEMIRKRSPLYQKQAANAPIEATRNAGAEHTIRGIVSGGAPDPAQDDMAPVVRLMTGRNTQLRDGIIDALNNGNIERAIMMAKAAEQQKQIAPGATLTLIKRIGLM